MAQLTVVRSDGEKARPLPDPLNTTLRTAIVVIAMGVMASAALLTARAIMMGSTRWKEVIGAGIALLAFSALQRHLRKRSRVVEKIVRRRHPIPLQLIG
jgi:hypothetical protein